MLDAAERGKVAEAGGERGVERALYSERLLAIGVPHAFSTRRGGVSGGMFDSLNFGNPGELAADRRDPRANIERNWALLKGAIVGRAGCGEVEGRRVVEVFQVHGVDVCVVERGKAEPRGAGGGDVRADAIVTDDPGRLAAVRVADCTPVLLASGDGRVVAAVHAGWRGVVGGVAPAAVDAMVRMGAEREGIVAAIGPCIGRDAFEVGEDVAAEFRRVFGAATAHVRASEGVAGKWLVDLQGALREQLAGCGVRAANIETIARCTASEPEWFFSHRRDRGLSGRMVGIIGARAG